MTEAPMTEAHMTEAHMTEAPLIRATSIVRRPAVKAERIADVLALDHAARQRRQAALTGQGGLTFLLDLERAGALEDGDAVKLEDGRLVEVRAAPERLIEITTGNALRLMRVGWHLGGRHVATEFTADAIYIAHDHALLEMVRGLGAKAVPVERPFRPERGASDDHVHGPDCGHAHAAGHDHDHDHASGHDHGHAAGHVHGPDCGRDHAPHDHAARDRGDHDHAVHDHGVHDHEVHGHKHG